MKIKNLFYFFTLLTFLFHKISFASNDYEIEILFFTSTSNLTTKEFHPRFFPLPTLQLGTNTIFHHIKPHPESENNPVGLEKYFEEFKKLGLQINYYFVQTLQSSLLDKKNIIVFSNQEELLNKLQTLTLKPIDYFSYNFPHLEMDSFLIGNIKIERINKNSIDVDLNIFCKTKKFPIKIRERRKVHFNEINYFDNSDLGMILVVNEVNN